MSRDVAPDVLARADAGAGVELLAEPVGERVCAGDLADLLERPLQRVDVGLLGEIGGVDQRRVVRIGRGESQPPAALRADHPGHQREAVRRPLHPRQVRGHVEDERLRVGSGQVGPAPREQMGVQRGRPRHDRRHRARRRADHRREQVVVQVLADAGEVDGDLEPDPRELGGRPDAGEHQQLRRLDRACAERRPRVRHAPLARRRRPRRSDRPRGRVGGRAFRSVRSGSARPAPAAGTRPSGSGGRRP